MTKRPHSPPIKSESESVDDELNALLAPSPLPKTPKKPKSEAPSSATKSTHKGALPKNVSPGKTFPAHAKRVLLERAMDLAYKGLPWADLAGELDISESRLKDQFKPGRSNVRKAVLDSYANSTGSASPGPSRVKSDE